MFEHERIENAITKREAQEAELYRPDGSKFYSDEEHKERMSAIKQEFDATFDHIEEDIGRQIAAAEEELLKLEHADPADVLTTEELERANAKRSFVADDCNALPLEKLEQRLRAALASGDRPTMFLLSHFASKRVGESYKYDPNNPEAARDEPGAQEVREIVAEIKKKLNPEGIREMHEARKALAEARELERHAYYRRRGATGAADLYMNRTYGGGTALVSP